VAVPESNDEELDPLILDNLEVDGAGQVPDVDPASSSLFIRSSTK
jgi:hypothetical protein